jgi:hypothetical protein
MPYPYVAMTVMRSASPSPISRSKHSGFSTSRVNELASIRTRTQQRALDHVDAVQGAFTRGDAGAGPPVHVGRMDLVDAGHRAMALREVADTVHRQPMG